ncbi:agamous-like MADS-box protein AGL62 [Gossypium raimondii]|uniref:agamous-like MADS-box protein AGL62 n=1 Tax=Gossypium raimondii TaxID=29730 RepID=UPI00227C0757|nr:agamous-like MADS-box protein AGL62 [Gossypium raimondii]
MIENDDDQLITFLKRKPFTFDHPSIESIANRFLNGNIPVIDDAHALIEAHRMVRINKVIQLYNEVHSQMDASNETQKVLTQQVTSGTNSNRWWETPLDQLNPRELYE